MSREIHVRFCEGAGVKFPRATRLVVLVDAHPSHEWLRGAVSKRIREELATGHSSRCFSFIQNWVEMKIRRHLARARLRQGFGWKRWSRRWLYEGLGLFNDYRIRHYAPSPKAAPAG